MFGTVKFTLLHAVFMERKSQRGNYMNEKWVLKTAISEQNFDIKNSGEGKSHPQKLDPDKFQIHKGRENVERNTTE